MNHALQRRLARLLPRGNDTLWLDCRTGMPRHAASLPTPLIIGLDFLAAADVGADVPAPSLVLDMDGGATMEDAIRAGADGILCSSRLPWPRLTLLAGQCRQWNYPFIADCRDASPDAVQRFFTLGAHVALAAASQPSLEIFPYCVCRIVPFAAAAGSSACL